MTNNINLMKMLNELSYNQFKNDAKTSSKQQQMNKAVKAINHKIKEINKLAEYTERLKSELQEDGGEMKRWKNTDLSLVKISETLSILTKKIKNIAK